MCETFFFSIIERSSLIICSSIIANIVMFDYFQEALVWKVAVQYKDINSEVLVYKARRSNKVILCSFLCVVLNESSVSPVGELFIVLWSVVRSQLVYKDVDFDSIFVWEEMIVVQVILGCKMVVNSCISAVLLVEFFFQ